MVEYLLKSKMLSTINNQIYHNGLFYLAAWAETTVTVHFQPVAHTSCFGGRMKSFSLLRDSFRSVDNLMNSSDKALVAKFQ